MGLCHQPFSLKAVFNKNFLILFYLLNWFSISLWWLPLRENLFLSAPHITHSELKTFQFRTDISTKNFREIYLLLLKRNDISLNSWKQLKNIFDSYLYFWENIWFFLYNNKKYGFLFCCHRFVVNLYKTWPSTQDLRLNPNPYKKLLSFSAAEVYFWITLNSNFNYIKTEAIHHLNVEKQTEYYDWEEFLMFLSLHPIS